MQEEVIKFSLWLFFNDFWCCAAYDLEDGEGLKILTPK